MRAFNTKVIEMFSFRITALFYCFRAVGKGYDVKLSDTEEELFSTAGKYSVNLSKIEGDENETV